MVKGKLALQLQKLGLVEAYTNKFQSTCPASYFRGRHHVDGMWHTRNIVPTSVSIFPFHFCVGDHRVDVVEFQMKSMLGDLSPL